MNLWIPEEIMFEIFSWLPVKSLLRFKCNTKFCTSLILESDFVNIHTCRSMSRSGRTKFILREKWESIFFTAEQREDEKDSTPFLQIPRYNYLYLHGLAYYSRLNCVNGLCCMWDSLSTRHAAIFNPSTREVRFLPNIDGELSPCNYSLGFEPEEKKFKVFSRYKERHWVFTLGIDKSWRENKNISFAIPYFKPSVCISGVIYQLINGAIAAIDIKSEKCETIALWNSSHELPNYYELIEVKGKLEVIDYRKWVGGYLDLWIFDQTPQRKWERHIIRLPSIWNAMKPGFVSSVMSHDGEIVFVVIFKSGGACLCYDVTRKSWRELKIMGLPKENYIKGIYSYVESLVSLG
uniref:F-box protein n=1 Tax=Solanum tuberosum TaxID=4113 RepID=M1CJK0_SOLTU